ncbi:zinc finger protein 699 [Ixodes scapularis]
MPAKIFIDLATKPFVADVVFPNGLPPGGFVTLFVGCCQKTPQPGKVVDSVIVPKSSTSVPVIRKTCHNQTYTEFCDGKIFVRNDVANFQVAAYPCSLRSSTSSPVLTSQEHGRLHIQKEVPDLCGNIVPFPKSELHYCHRCSFFSLLREEKLHHDSLHGGSRQQCLLCRRFFKNGTTLNQHLCLHLQRCVRCDVCSRIFSSKEARARHLERNCDAPPIVEPTRPLIQLLPPPPPEPVVVEVAPVASNLTVEVPSPPDDTACASASVSPLPETQILACLRTRLPPLRQPATISAPSPCSVFLAANDDIASVFDTTVASLPFTRPASSSTTTGFLATTGYDYADSSSTGYGFQQQFPARDTTSQSVLLKP